MKKPFEKLLIEWIFYLKNKKDHSVLVKLYEHLTDIHKSVLRKNEFYYTEPSDDDLYDFCEIFENMMLILFNEKITELRFEIDMEYYSEDLSVRFFVMINDEDLGNIVNCITSFKKDSIHQYVQSITGEE